MIGTRGEPEKNDDIDTHWKRNVQAQKFEIPIFSQAITGRDPVLALPDEEQHDTVI